MTVQACPPSAPIPPGVVVFVPATFIELYPMFATVAPAALNQCFLYATTMMGNSCGSRVRNPFKRELYLNMLTAHITALLYGQNGQPAPGIVGRVDKATEGSVSVSAVMDTNGVYGKDWYVQTQWGAIYWNATAWARRGVYIAPPPTCADNNGGIGGPFWTGGGGCGC